MVSTLRINAKLEFRAYPWAEHRDGVLWVVWLRVLDSLRMSGPSLHITILFACSRADALSSRWTLTCLLLPLLIIFPTRNAGFAILVHFYSRGMVVVCVWGRDTLHGLFSASVLFSSCRVFLTLRAGVMHKHTQILTQTQTQTKTQPQSQA